MLTQARIIFGGDVVLCNEVKKLFKQRFMNRHYIQTDPTTAELIKCVSYLDEGLVVLPGLQNLEDKSWENIGLQHPQYSLKKLTRIAK